MNEVIQEFGFEESNKVDGNSLCEGHITVNYWNVPMEERDRIRAKIVGIVSSPSPAEKATQTENGKGQQGDGLPASMEKRKYGFKHFIHWHLQYLRLLPGAMTKDEVAQRFRKHFPHASSNFSDISIFEKYEECQGFKKEEGNPPSSKDDITRYVGDGKDKPPLGLGDRVKYCRGHPGSSYPVGTVTEVISNKKLGGRRILIVFGPNDQRWGSMGDYEKVEEVEDAAPSS